MKVPYFNRIEVPFLQNLSTLFGQCPLTFEVLPQLLGFCDMHNYQGRDKCYQPSHRRDISIHKNTCFTS